MRCWIIHAWIEQVDISSSTITLNLINDYDLGAITPLAGFALTSLDYDGPITDVTIVQNQIGDLSLSFGVDYIDFHFLSNIEVPPYSSETFVMQVTAVSVPEPATICLVALGAVLLKRRK